MDVQVMAVSKNADLGRFLHILCYDYNFTFLISSNPHLWTQYWSKSG